MVKDTFICIENYILLISIHKTIKRVDIQMAKVGYTRVSTQDQSLEKQNILYNDECIC